MRCLAATAALGAALLANGCAARAVPGPYPADDWRRVTSLSAGTDVRIWRVDPAGQPPPVYGGPQPNWNIRRDDGRIMAVDSSAVTISTPGGPLRIPRDGVRRVDVVTKEPDSVQNGFLAGLVIGGVPGLYIWAGSAKTSDPFGPAPFFLGTAIGAAIGTFADYARERPRTRTVYVERR